MSGAAPADSGPELSVVIPVYNEGRNIVPVLRGLAPSLPTLENIHARKTGALFRACLRLGGCVALGEAPGGVGRRSTAHLGVKQRSPLRKSFMPARRHRRHTGPV